MSSEGEMKEIHDIVQSIFAKDAWTDHWEPDHLGGSNVREKLKRVLELSTPSPSSHMRGAADAYVTEQAIEHSGGIIERAFEAGARWSARRSLPDGFTRKEIEDMLSVVQDEPQTIDGGGEFGPQESTDGWYARLLRTILKNSDGSR